MKLSTGVTAFFALSCLLSFILPLIKGRLDWRWSSADMRRFGVIGLGFLLLYGLAFCFKLETAAAFPWFLGGFGGWWLLTGLGLGGLPGGIILLLASFWIFQASMPFETGQTDLTAFLFGLTAACLGTNLLHSTDRTADKPAESAEAQQGLAASVSSEEWSALALPATWLIGNLWIGNALPESGWVQNSSLLAIFIGLSLLLRTIGSLPILPASPRLLRPLFILLTGGLGAWLAVQSFLVQPALLNWVWLYAGGVLLAALLSIPEENPASPSRALIRLVLIGLAALVASRLFGTLGWVVLGAGLLAFPQTTAGLAIATLFFLGRGLLQVFLFEHNANLTGINLTHPYAAAALYGGFALMLLLPKLLNRSGNLLNPSNLPAATLLVLGGTLMGGLSNYFLHAEATGSLLNALLAAGLGISLLGAFRDARLSSVPMAWSLLVTAGVLAGNPLIALGNQAEKPEKLAVLAVALLIALALFWWSQRGASGSQPVEVA